MFRPRTLIQQLARLVLCAVLSGCTAPDFGDSEAGLALEDLSSGLAPSRLAAQVPQPARESISFMTGGEEREADHYRPLQGARAGIVLVPGVAAGGRRDARVVAVANTLARLGFAVLVPDMPGVRRFHRVKAPTSSELNQLSHTIARRLARYLERQGLLERDAEHSTLTLDDSDEGPMDQLRGHSITYRIAVGPQQGRKVFTLQTLPGIEEPFNGCTGQAAGFSLHAGVAARADQRDKLERLCRYITRPAVSEKRLSLTNQGQVRYELKTPYRDGTTHVIFEPVDFIAKLAALVPKPRVNLTRFHGVFAPNSKHRVLVTPAKRGKGSKHKAADGQEEQMPVQRHAAMTWAQRLKRVFKLDVETCRVCGGSARVIACIEDPVVIKKILTYLEEKLPTRAALLLPDSRAPPQSGLFG